MYISICIYLCIYFFSRHKTVVSHSTHRRGSNLRQGLGTARAILNTLHSCRHQGCGASQARKNIPGDSTPRKNINDANWNYLRSGDTPTYNNHCAQARKHGNNDSSPTTNPAQSKLGKDKLGDQKCDAHSLCFQIGLLPSNGTYLIVYLGMLRKPFV